MTISRRTFVAGITALIMAKTPSFGSVPPKKITLETVINYSVKNEKFDYSDFDVSTQVVTALIRHNPRIALRSEFRKFCMNNHEKVLDKNFCLDRSRKKAEEFVLKNQHLYYHTLKE